MNPKIRIFFNLFIIILLISPNVKSESESNLLSMEFYETPQMYDSLTNCLIEVVKKEILAKLTVVILEDEDMLRKEALQFFSEMTRKLMEKNVPRIVTENISDLIETRYVDTESVVCLIYYDNCEQLARFDGNIIDESIRVIVVINNFSDEACKHLYKNIGVVTSKYHVTFFTMTPSDDEHKILTFLPEINSITCKLEENLKPTHINTCIKNKLLNGKVFPLKAAQNFHKCPIRIGMGDLHPFAVITSYNELKELEPIYEVRGCDYEILKIVASQINAGLSLYKIKTVANNAFAEWGFIKYLENGTLDVCAGGLYRIYGDTVKYSGIYARQVIIWTYAVERDQRSLKNLVEKTDGLYLFFLFYLYYSLVWYFLRWFENQRVSIHVTLLYSFGALIGAASLPEARTTKQKIVNGLYLILCIYTATFINILLYSFLTISHPPTIYKTNNDILNSGKRVFLNPYAKNFVDDKRIINFINKTENCEDFMDCEKKALATKSITVLLDGQFIEFQAITAENDEARFLRTADSVLTIYHEMPIRKDSLVLDNLQNIMMRLKEAGILDKLYDEGLGILNVSRSEVFTKNTLTNSYYCQKGCKITLQDFSVAFYFLIVGKSLSCLVLYVEIISVKYK